MNLSSSTVSRRSSSGSTEDVSNDVTPTASSTAFVVSLAGAAFVAGFVVRPLLLSSWKRFILLKGNSSTGTRTEGGESETTQKKTKEKETKKDNNNKNISTEADAEAHLWRIVANSFTLTLICACDVLKLYDKLSADGITAYELSKKTGWSQRWITELLAQQASAGLCRYDATTQRFTINPCYKPFLLGPEQSKKSLIGLFPFVRALVGRKDAVVNAVITGIGVDYDFGGSGDDKDDDDDDDDNVIMSIDRKNRNFFKYHLVDEIISKVKVRTKKNGGTEETTSLLKMLESGNMNNVADIGCGCGSSTIAMAERFPLCNFYSYESSPKSVRILQERILAQNLMNVTVCDVNIRTVGDGPDINDPSSEFDFVYSHDVLHDMTQPQSFIEDVYRRLAVNAGVWVIVDVDCKSALEDNIELLPNSDLLYGFSCTLCLQSATSDPQLDGGGEGLGTCGFSSDVARKWMSDVGFTRVDTMRIESLPRNSCFVVGK